MVIVASIYLRFLDRGRRQSRYISTDSDSTKFLPIPTQTPRPWLISYKRWSSIGIALMEHTVDHLYASCFQNLFLAIILTVR
jgi:hypothetical protein